MEEALQSLAQEVPVDEGHEEGMYITVEGEEDGLRGSSGGRGRQRDAS